MGGVYPVDLTHLGAATLARLQTLAAEHDRSPADQALEILRAALSGGDVRADVNLLLDCLGATAVAALTGSRLSSIPAQWAEPGGPLPDQVAADRLSLAAEVWRQLFEALGDGAAQQWFLQHNRELGGDTPLIAIRNLGRAQLTAAVAAAISETP